jgi:hypothetical protein
MSQALKDLDILLEQYENEVAFLENRLIGNNNGGPLMSSYQQMHREAVVKLMQCTEDRKRLQKGLDDAASSTTAPVPPVARKAVSAVPIGFANALSHWFPRTVNDELVDTIEQRIPIFGTSKSLQCGICEKYLGNSGALAAHQEACKRRKITAPPAASAQSKPTPINELFAHRDARLQVAEEDPVKVVKPDQRRKGGARFRKRYRASFKMKVVEITKRIAVQYKLSRGGQAITAEFAGIDASLVSRWTQGYHKLTRFLKRTAGSKGAGNVGRVLFAESRGRKAQYPAAEAIVMVRVDQARQKRMPVTARSLKSWMKAAVKTVEDSKALPDDGGLAALRRPFSASNHWLVRFAERNSLVVRRATNKKETSIAERLPKVQQFHSTLQSFISAPAAPGESSDERFGRFLPENCFNMDQSPLFLDSTSNATYDRRPSITVGISKRKGSDQRFATLTICVRLAGTPDKPVPQPFISIIFKGTGQRISAQEREAYAPGVFVDFQPKAWTDSDTLQRWSDKFIDWTRANCDGKRKMLFLDNLKAQTLGEFRDRLSEGNVKVWLLPPNCTDLIQPVDRHLAQHLKMRIRNLLEDKLMADEAFHQRWLGKGDADLRAKDVRILLTQIVAEAWKQICRDRNFFELGLSTGCVMVKPAVDRDREGLANIHITGLTEAYAFPVAPAHQELAQQAPAEEAEPAEEASAAAGDHPEDVFTTLAAGEIQKAPKRSGKKKNVPKTSAKKAKVEVSSSSSSSDSSEASGSDENNQSEDSLDSENGDNDANEGDAFSPMEQGIEDDDTLVQDLGLLKDHLADSTKALDNAQPLPLPPLGYAFAPLPEGAMRVSSISNRKIYWRIPLGPTGEPDWIVAQIIGGPPDPVALANGITMQLLCTLRMDRKTPAYMREKQTNQLVALNEENFGVEWILLKDAK